MKHFAASLLTALLLAAPALVALPALAISLDEAKRSGAVGEKRNGYIDAAKPNPSPEVQKLISEINQKRRAAYGEIAKKNGSPQALVEQVGAKEAFEKSAPGTPIEGADGSWTTKR